MGLLGGVQWHTHHPPPAIGCTQCQYLASVHDRVASLHSCQLLMWLHAEAVELVALYWHTPFGPMLILPVCVQQAYRLTEAYLTDASVNDHIAIIVQHDCCWSTASCPEASLANGPFA